MSSALKISVIIPVHNEEDNIAPLLQELTALLPSTPIVEIIYVDDGSTDKTLDILHHHQGKISCLRVLQHTQRGGQSAGMWTGAQAATGDLLVFLDGDGQNDPADIPTLLSDYKQAIAKPGQARAAIMGQRRKRQDNGLRRFASRTANGIRSRVLQDGVEDTGCSLKLIRRTDYLALPYFNHMHRFLPALLIREGVTLSKRSVSHRPRERGVSKYGFWDRLWVGVADLLGVLWLQNRAKPKNFGYIEINSSSEKRYESRAS